MIKKIVHQWHINDCIVYLMKTQDTRGHSILEYKTMKNKTEIYIDRIEIPESESIEEAISFIKTCKAAADETGIVNFFENHHTWVNTNREFSSKGDKLLEIILKVYKYWMDDNGNADLFKNPIQWLKAVRANAECNVGIDLEPEPSDMEMDALSLLVMLEQFDMIDHAENVFSVENIFMNTFSNYCTWKYDPNIEINLTSGPEGLVWNIFHKATKESSFYHFQEITRPSLRCHPQTVDLIEKIKNEANSDVQLLCCLMRDFNVSVIDSEIFKKELSTEVDQTKEDYVNSCINARNHMTMRVLMPTTAASIYPLICAVMAAARSAKVFAGGGVLGAIIGGCTGIVIGATALRASITAALNISRNISSYFYATPDSLCKKQEILNDKNFLLPLQSSVIIEVEPICTPSAIDERVLISKFTWCVTLVTHRGMFGNHAQIIIEGINDGFYCQNSAKIGAAKAVKIGDKFIHLTDFSPKIRYGLLSCDDLKYETRTETWMRSSDQVKKMLEAIEQEIYLPEEKRHPFNFWGIHSKIYKFNPFAKKCKIFSGRAGDNCFTFLREKLRMIDIDVAESYTDLIAAVVKNYTRKKEEYETLPIQELI